MVAQGQEWREGWIAKGHEKTFGDDGNVYYLDCDNGLTGVCKCQNSSNFIP